MSDTRLLARECPMCGNTRWRTEAFLQEEKSIANAERAVIAAAGELVEAERSTLLFAEAPPSDGWYKKWSASTHRVQMARIAHSEAVAALGALEEKAGSG